MVLSGFSVISFYSFLNDSSLCCDWARGTRSLDLEEPLRIIKCSLAFMGSRAHTSPELPAPISVPVDHPPDGESNL